MIVCVIVFGFFFQAEDGIRDLVRSRGLGDVYKRQGTLVCTKSTGLRPDFYTWIVFQSKIGLIYTHETGCLLYTSDAADERSSVDLGGRRIIKKKKNVYYSWWRTLATITLNEI